MMKEIAATTAFVIILGGATVYGMKTGFFNKEEQFKVDDCIKLSWEGVETWNSSTVAKIRTVGKANYEVRYWAEYGWTNLTDTWPFSQPVTKVACPVEVKD